MSAQSPHMSSFQAIKPEVSKIITRKSCPLPVVLYDLLRLQSPSRSEDKVRALIMKELTAIGGVHVETDQKGNLWAWVGEKKVYDTVFSAHMDTVHNKEGKQRLIITTDAAGPGKEGIVYAAEEEREYNYTPINGGASLSAVDISSQVFKDGGKYYRILPTQNKDLEIKHPGKDVVDVHKLLSKEDTESKKSVWGHFIRTEKNVKYNSCVLGADDKLGCYALIELIRLRYPATYIFHVEEESGGQGSSWIRYNLADQLKGSKRAIAFDRSYYKDVIGSQRSFICCSTVFGKALAGALNEYMPPLGHFKEGAVGSFTDTANYTTIIPECTNISVGYFNQHSHNEHFDSVFFLDMLMPAIKKIKWDNLPTVRDVASQRSAYDSHYYSGGNGYTTTRNVWMNGRWMTPAERDALMHEDGSHIDHDPNGTVTTITTTVTGTTRVSVKNYSTNDVLDTKYYTERGFDAPWVLTSRTSWEKIPEWNPSMQDFCGKVSAAQMQIILAKWLMSKDDYVDVTRTLHEIITSNRKNREEAMTSKRERDDLTIKVSNLEGHVTKLTEELRHAVEDLGYVKKEQTQLPLPAPTEKE